MNSDYKESAVVHEERKIERVEIIASLLEMGYEGKAIKHLMIEHTNIQDVATAVEYLNLDENGLYKH
jgi:hypothetical protein